MTRETAEHTPQLSAPLVGTPMSAAARALASDEGVGHLAVIRELLQSSGIYALASLASPLISLVLSPFLTHHLSRTDYGALAVLMTIVALAVGITQLSLGSAFFRTYKYDYESERDRLDVLATVVALLMIISIPTSVAAFFAAPWLAQALLGSPSFAFPVQLAAVVVLLENLSVPGLAWLRADSHPAAYSSLSVMNLLASLVGMLVLVGIFHLGISGALLGTGLGYATVVIATLPNVLRRAGLHLRLDMMQNLLSFGVPLVSGVLCSWVLQLSDRYLLSHFGSLTQTASYDVAYKLGGGLAVVVLSPFQLAWPTVQFAVAKKANAPHVFRLIFRWYSVVLLLVTYALSLVGIAVLYLLFPPVYHSVALLIPIIALSLMFFGVTSVLAVGFGIRRKTWLASLIFALSALANLGLNIVLIPRYGAVGAAVSTLLAYIVLAAASYVVNQRIYPVPLETGRFVIATVVGAAVFAVTALLGRISPGPLGWISSVVGLFIYTAWLALLVGGRDGLRLLGASSLSRWFIPRGDRPAGGRALSRALISASRREMTRQPAVRVCMHVLGSARNDVRVLREAVTLAQAGLAVTIVDVEHERQLARQEDLTGIPTRHIIMPSWFTPTCFKAWFLVKAGWILICGTVALVTTPADIYHAHDFTALPACYLAARLRRKPLIYDAHELPLVDPNVTRWRWLCAAAVSVLRAIVPHCAALITVSPPIAHELQRRYAGPPAVVVRNIPAYQTPVQSNRLCQHLGLDPDSRVALYQGNLQADRGLDALIRAAKFLAPSIVIIIMGHGDMQPKLEALITQEGLGHRIKIIPPVPYQQLLEWTASADLGLILNPPAYSPNVRMCLPNKLFEYMMAGLPVLSSPLEAVEDIINTYEVGRILTSLQPEEIGHFINWMLADSQVLAGMATRAAAVTKYTLCWEHESRKLLQLYHEVLNSARLESPPTLNLSPDV